MSENCGDDYYNIFMVQLVKTLAQLTAGVLSASVTVPMYNYYVKNLLNIDTNKLDSDLEVEQDENSESENSENGYDGDEEIDINEMSDSENQLEDKKDV